MSRPEHTRSVSTNLQAGGGSRALEGKLGIVRSSTMNSSAVTDPAFNRSLARQEVCLTLSKSDLKY